MLKVKDFRPWFHRGKVICIALTGCDGINYYHPVCPYTSAYWDEDLIHHLMRDGYVVVIVGYGLLYDIPDSYNIIPESCSQLSLDF